MKRSAAGLVEVAGEAKSVLSERGVDLLQVQQRGIAGAEIIRREGGADLVELAGSLRTEFGSVNGASSVISKTSCSGAGPSCRIQAATLAGKSRGCSGSAGR